MGIFISVGMIMFSFSPVAKGDDANWWNSFLAGPGNDWFDWNDVFNPLSPSEQGKDLYNLIYRKQTRDSGNTALTDIAKSYGLTTNEARAVLDGSLTPIFNHPQRKGTTLTIETAEKIAADMQENFLMLKEIYQLTSEVELAVKPSEMFANGDLSDSGFDLVHDLAMIEKVLFLEQKPISVGGMFDGALTSPYVPIKPANEFTDYVANTLETATLGLSVEEKADGEKEAKINLDEDAEDQQDDEQIVKAEVLEEDVCIDQSSLEAAVDDLDDEDGAEGDGDGQGDGGSADDDGEEDDGGGDGDDDGGDDVNELPDAIDASGKVKGAPPDKWGSQWCPGLEEPGSFAGAQAQFPPDMFKSASGSSSKAILSGGAASNYEVEGFSAHVGVCFETKFIKETVVSYQPGESCIACEVAQINKALEKTLSHSLIPSKSTGNLMESAKCKKTGSLISMQFTTIFNPIPTPVKDELIFGKSIAEEWNKFADNYKPLLLQEIKFDSPDDPELSGDFQTKAQENMSLPGTTQTEVVDQVRKVQAQATADAAFNISKAKTANDATNKVLFLKSLFGEVKQMNDLFQTFQDTFKKMEKDALSELVQKPSK